MCPKLYEWSDAVLINEWLGCYHCIHFLGACHLRWFFGKRCDTILHYLLFPFCSSHRKFFKVQTISPTVFWASLKAPRLSSSFLLITINAGIPALFCSMTGCAKICVAALAVPLLLLQCVLPKTYDLVSKHATSIRASTFLCFIKIFNYKIVKKLRFQAARNLHQHGFHSFWTIKNSKFQTNRSV